MTIAAFAVYASNLLVQPTHHEQMSTLRSLLIHRFKLTFHREQKDFSIYELEVAKSGPRFKPSA
jgi:uncharacterized protein (TIGR03435 family)